MAAKGPSHPLLVLLLGLLTSLRPASLDQQRSRVETVASAASSMRNRRALEVAARPYHAIGESLIATAHRPLCGQRHGQRLARHSAPMPHLARADMDEVAVDAARRAVNLLQSLVHGINHAW